MESLATDREAAGHTVSREGLHRLPVGWDFLGLRN
jgi:hypothetical protein